MTCPYNPIAHEDEMSYSEIAGEASSMCHPKGMKNPSALPQGSPACNSLSSEGTLRLV